jgi:hypothetical protein
VENGIEGDSAAPPVSLASPRPRPLPLTGDGIPVGTAIELLVESSSFSYLALSFSLAAAARSLMSVMWYCVAEVGSGDFNTEEVGVGRAVGALVPSPIISESSAASAAESVGFVVSSVSGWCARRRRGHKSKEQ